MTSIEPQHAVVRRARAARVPGRASTSRTIESPAVPHAGAMDQSAASRFPRLFRNDRRRRGSRRRCGRGRRIEPHRAGRAHRHRGGRPRSARSRATPSRWCSTASSTSRAATCSPIRRTRRRSPTRSAAHLIWMHEASLFPGRSYLMKIGTQQTTATVTALKHQLDVNTLAHACREDAVAQPGRLLQPVDRGADRVRSLCGEPRHRRASS